MLRQIIKSGGECVGWFDLGGMIGGDSTDIYMWVLKIYIHSHTVKKLLETREYEQEEEEEEEQFLSDPQDKIQDQGK